MKNLTKKSIISLILTFIMIFNVVPFGAFTSVVNAAGEYDATIDDIDIGTVVEGYDKNDFVKSVRLTNTGTESLVGGADYMKIELTSGDTGAFECNFRDSGYIPSTYRADKAYVCPKTGLTAGTYTATLTLSYDRDGDETAYSWEVLDTATVTVKVNAPTISHNIIVENGTSDKSTASEGEIIRLSADLVSGNMAFSEWEVISGGITITNKNTAGSAFFTMPNNEVRIRAKYVNLNYSATIGDVNVGTTGEGFNPNDFRKSVPFTNTGSGALDGGANYMKIEFTSGDIDAFGCDFINTGYILSGGTPNKAYVYPKTGLTAGTYTATLTLSYDRDGDETAYDWEELDTATITFKVNGSGVTKHTVTFYDGSTVLTTLTQQVNDGEKATKPEPDPTKTGGYAFINWYADALMTTPFDFANTSITKATPIYAKFVKQHTITFDSNGGSGSIPDIIVNDGTDFDFPTSSGFTAPGGKEFDKWEVSGYGTFNPGASFQPSGDLIVKAIWKDIVVTPTEHTVTFELNGGTMTGTNPVKVNEGGKVTQPADPTRTGYYFEGWYKESTFNNRFEFTTETISGNTSIYAKWLPKVVGMDLKTEGTEMNGANYRLKVKSLDVNFHTSATPVTIDSKVVSDLYVDNTGTTPLTTAPVAGTTYYFTVLLAAGDDYIPKVFWDDAMKTGSVGTATNATIGYSDLFRSPGSGSAMILFTYKELSQPVNIAVDYNGGTNNGFVSSPLEKGSVINKSDVEASLNSPLVTPPTNKEFDYLEIDGVKWTSDTYTVNSDITVKIIWKDKAVTQHTVTFFNDEGGVISSTNVNSGEKVTRPSTDPTKAGYRFDDWYADASMTIAFDFTNTQITTDTKIYAKFIEQVKITLELNGGTANVSFSDGMEDKGIIIYRNVAENFYKDTSVITPPTDKEFDYIEINGTKWTEDTYTVNNNITIKLIWKDKAATPTYTILEGANQTYTIDSNVDVVIKASGTKANLSKIQIDGTDLDTAHYNTEEGSTILTLKASYLNALSVGEHTVKFAYDDGEVSTTLKVAQNGNSGNTDPSNPTDPSGNNTGTNTNNENNNTNTGSNTTNTTGTTENTSTNTSTNTTSSKTPKTGDNIVVWIALLVVATIGTVGTVKYLRKKD